MSGNEEAVRRAGKYAAWDELLEGFSDKDRNNLSRLMAHGWKISAIEITNTQGGRNYSSRIEKQP